MPRGIYIRTESHRESNRKAQTGIKRGPLSKEHKDKLSIFNKGIKRPEITGPRHPNWKGGVSKMYTKEQKAV